MMPARDKDKQPNYFKFEKDMKKAGFPTQEYRGRWSWKGPAVFTNESSGPTLQDVIRTTKVPLQWDSMGLDFVAYPAATEERWS